VVTSTDPRMRAADLGALVAAVQRNCDLSDAAHAQNLSLCIYLLQMREFFRWERGLALEETPERGEVGRWIASREAHWETLASELDGGFGALPIGEGVDPFDEAAVNARLAAEGLVYGAGVAGFGRPEFVLAERARSHTREGATVIVTGSEHARGMNPPVAVSRGDLILVRRDVLRRWLATRVELSRMRPSTEGLAAALEAWRPGDDPRAALERIADIETETLILHELGERRAAQLLGPDWERMLASLESRHTEIVARALRDLLADCVSTLPGLLAREARGSVHFWFANLEGMRRLLAPELPEAYARWKAGDTAALADALDAGSEHWLAQARSLLHAWRSGGEPGARAFSDDLAGAASSRSPSA